MPNLVPLSLEQHSDLKLKPVSGFEHVKEAHIVPIVAHEFVSVSADVPIVFVKNAETGQFQSVAMLGLKPEENLLVDGKMWMGMYIPGIVTTYPFRLLPADEQGEKMMLAVDMESDQLSTEEGQPFFEDGKETEFLEKRKEAVGMFLEHSQMTRLFIEHLVNLDLIQEKPLTVDVEGQSINLTGLFFVDEQKLNELSDEAYLDLRKRGFLQVIYAHLVSVQQIRRLGKFQSDRNKNGK